MTRRLKAASAAPQPDQQSQLSLIVFLADDYYYHACVLFNRTAEFAMLLLPNHSDDDVHPPNNVGDLCDRDDEELAVLCGIDPDVWAGMNAERRVPRMQDAIRKLGATTANGRIVNDEMQPVPPPAEPRLTVDEPRMTITLDGATFDVRSKRAIRWVRILAANPGVWISGPELERAERPLLSTGEESLLPLETRTNRLLKLLPEQVQSLINSETGKGSRIRL